MSKEAIIYTSETGGLFVKKYTTEMINIVRGLTGKEPTVVPLNRVDDETKKRREKVWEKSGLRAVYPLLFVDDEFVGTMEQVVDLNEREELKEKLI